MTVSARQAQNQTITRIMQSLSAFAALSVLWVSVDLMSEAVKTQGLLSSLAALLFVGALVALFAVLWYAAKLLRLPVPESQ